MHDHAIPSALETWLTGRLKADYDAVLHEGLPAEIAVLLAVDAATDRAGHITERR